MYNYYLSNWKYQGRRNLWRCGWCIGGEFGSDVLARNLNLSLNLNLNLNLSLNLNLNLNLSLNLSLSLSLSLNLNDSYSRIRSDVLVSNFRDSCSSIGSDVMETIRRKTSWCRILSDVMELTRAFWKLIMIRQPNNLVIAFFSVRHSQNLVVCP